MGATALLLLASPWRAAAQEAPALEVRATMSAVDGEVLFRPGELFVGDPTLPGRPAVQALAPQPHAVLPAPQDGFELLSAACPEPRSAPDAGAAPTASAPVVVARGDLGGDGRVETVTVRRGGAVASAELQVLRGDRVVAQGSLPVPAEPCRGLVAEVEPGGAPELLLVWTSQGADRVTVGVTVFALPESAF